MSDPVRVDPAFATASFYQTADGRWMHPMGPYARLRNDTAALLGVPERQAPVAKAIASWDALELEEAGERAGVIMPMCRTTDELIETEQYRQVLASMPPVVVEQTGDSDPEPAARRRPSATRGCPGAHHRRRRLWPGAGAARCRRAERVGPNEYELPMLYTTSNVGMRSTMPDLREEAGATAMQRLLRGADIFFANRRPGYLARHGLDAAGAAAARPGIIHASVNLNGETGPWSGRIGFDQTAGALAGVMLAEGEDGVPTLPQVPVVNDYITSWFVQLGIIQALMRRAEHGGSYKVTVSLTRTALWLRSLGIFDKAYAREVAGKVPGHENLAPQTFTADSALGRYQGVTEQVRMSQTPGYYSYPLIPRGSHRPEWIGGPR